MVYGFIGMTGVTYAETRKTLVDAHKHDITCNSSYMSTGMYEKNNEGKVTIRKEGISIYHIEEQNSVGAPAPNLSKVIHTTFTLTLYRIRRRRDRRNTTGNPTRQRPPRQPLDDEIY